jgi:predicted metal-dependent hydrolase
MDHVKIHKVVRSRRRTIALVVGADATLTVRAPMQTSMEYIEDLVRRKLKWIKNKIAEVEARPPASRKRFESGESFLYLGDPYRLHIVSNAEVPLAFKREFVLAREYRDKARELLVNWYKQEARKKLTDRVEWHARRFGLTVGPIRITDAQKRWGSCSRSNSLNFSWRLIMAPLRVVDYVVIHELAHTVERSHSRDFWKKVFMMCPTHRSSMEWLKKNEHLLQI